MTERQQKLLNRCDNKCELCGGPLETIYSLLRKGKPQEDDPLYSMLALCKHCAATLKRGSKVKTSRSVKLLIFNNKDHTIKPVDGKLTNKAIKETIKGDYDIVGPFLQTDIISKSKISYMLSQE